MGAHKKAANEPLPILYPAEAMEPVMVKGHISIPMPDGLVLLQRNLVRRGDPRPGADEKRGQTEFRAVKRFVTGRRSSKRFQPIIQLLEIARGNPVHPKWLKEGLRTLVGEAFGQPLADAVSEQALADPKYFSRRWLPALFNQEIKKTRMVMWWPEDAPWFIPAIYCNDEETAILVSLLFGGVELCPGCGLPFIRHRKQQFHSANCAARYRMARWRKRQQRSKPRKQGRKGAHYAKN
jgi:hypothetical protein